jgi:hypothetical protein
VSWLTTIFRPCRLRLLFGAGLFNPLLDCARLLCFWQSFSFMPEILEGLNREQTEQDFSVIREG